MSDARATSALDFVLGRKLRTARTEAGLSQQALAAKLGITFQQIQKYEKGANRIAASRLVSIASVLGRPISYFLDEAKEAAGTVKSAKLNGDGMSSSEQVALTAFFSSIDDKKIRRRVLDTLRAVADAETAKRAEVTKSKRIAPKKPIKKKIKSRHG